jgi:iron complex outermembrane receptor protein
LEFDGSASYLHFKYVRLDPSVLSITGNMVTPYTPTWKWSAGVQYAIAIGSWGTLTPRLDASYQSGVFSAASNSPSNRIDGYTLANARLTWSSASDTWQIALEATNIGDKYYFLTKFDLSGVGAGFTSGQPGMPREIAVKVRRTFQ